MNVKVGEAVGEEFVGWIIGMLSLFYTGKIGNKSKPLKVFRGILIFRTLVGLAAFPMLLISKFVDKEAYDEIMNRDVF